jgi:hypothetical protein
MKGWLDRNYRAIMLTQMALELFLVGVIAVFEVLNYFQGR